VFVHDWQRHRHGSRVPQDTESGAMGVEPSARGPRSHRELAGTPISAELLIDCEADRTLRAVLVGMLRESQR